MQATFSFYLGIILLFNNAENANTPAPSASVLVYIKNSITPAAI